MSCEALATDPDFAAVPSLGARCEMVALTKLRPTKPLSGKVKPGRWLKWKLCANIYTSLMGPSRICRAVWATYSNRTFCPRTRAPDTRGLGYSEPEPEGETADFGHAFVERQ